MNSLKFTHRRQKPYVPWNNSTYGGPYPLNQIGALDSLVVILWKKIRIKINHLSRLLQILKKNSWFSWKIQHEWTGGALAGYLIFELFFGENHGYVTQQDLWFLRIMVMNPNQCGQLVPISNNCPTLVWTIVVSGITRLRHQLILVSRNFLNFYIDQLMRVSVYGYQVP
jgi:hypothetical protein